jgi:hypothetical protein
MMANFGWSYPPGCTGTPFDEDYPCEICGQFDDKCCCPICWLCGSVGDIFCYKEHGLFMMAYQVESLAAMEMQWELEDRDYWDQMERECQDKPN